MEPILSRCGYRCDQCLAYRPNVEADPENRRILSDGWFEYFGFRIPPEEILCDGCMADDPKLIDQACPVRPCAMQKGLRICSDCEDYACGKLAERLVVYEQIAGRRDRPIPPEDRARFILPYENKERLDDLRARPASRHGDDSSAV